MDENKVNDETNREFKVPRFSWYMVVMMEYKASIDADVMISVTSQLNHNMH